MRLGIYGGSFNPVHNGHIFAVQIFIQRMNLDRAVLLPAKNPFFKSTCRIDFRHRFAMCLSATETLSNVEVSDLEDREAGGAYTCDVLKRIKEQFQNADVFLLMGSDVYRHVPLWKGIDEIIETASICVLGRTIAPEDDSVFSETTDLLRKKGAQVFHFGDEGLPISSTLIREKAARGDPIDSLVGEKVAAYIRRHGLYAGKAVADEVPSS